jgi:glycosyltransferase involved in cell wall biosynthesis
MKIFAFNDKLNNPQECGSFTVVARKLNEELKKQELLGNLESFNDFIIYPEVFDTGQRWHKQVPYLACEYSLAPQIVIDKLKSYNPLVLAISEFAKKNLINSGYDNVRAVHLGTNPELWKKINVSKFNTFTYLTVNTSNERSGFEKLLPAFIEFSRNKNVKLIIKDGQNESFEKFIKLLNNPKIEYISSRLSEETLRELYNRSHLFLYANHTTSFGMNPMDSVLCGTPAIVTLGSALKEFIPDWSQPIKIKTTVQELDESSILEWTSMGINCFPPSFLNCFQNKIYGERVIEKDILNALEYSYNNYKEYLEIAQEHRKYILENYTWEKCVKNIKKELENYV